MPETVQCSLNALLSSTTCLRLGAQAAPFCLSLSSMKQKKYHVWEERWPGEIWGPDMRFVPSFCMVIFPHPFFLLHPPQQTKKKGRLLVHIV